MVCFLQIFINIIKKLLVKVNYRKWIQTNRLTLCDISTSINNLPANFLIQNDSKSVFERAQKFWYYF